jgi:uncharacterized membrane protein
VPTPIGPVQMITVAFEPDAKFDGHIIDELTRLERERTIRILDLLFVLKDADSGELLTLEHQGEELGTVVGAMLGLASDGAANERMRAEGVGDRAFGMTTDEIQELAASLEPGHSAGFLLIEHVWARDFKQAIRDAGGVLLSEAFLTPETVQAMEPELAAMAAAQSSNTNGER